MTLVIRVLAVLAATFLSLQSANACLPKEPLPEPASLTDTSSSCSAESDVDPITPVLACFVEGLAAQRPAGGRFTVDDIDPSLCTHVVYCYADFNMDTNRIDMTSKVGDYRRLESMKERNPNLKITLATGGWDAGSVKFSKMTASKDARATFTSSVVELLKLYKLDGLDIDWRDPGTRGGSSYDKANYVQLCEELKQEFSKFGWQLTVFVTGRLMQLDVGYDLEGLAEHTDYFYVITFDYHGGWDGYMGHTAPLYPRVEESGIQREFNVNFTVTTILSRGIPASKLVIAITLYAYIYHYRDLNNKGFGAATIWKNDYTGPYTKDRVKMGYNELCEILSSEGQYWTHNWQDDHKVPYVSMNDISISYENERSIDIKLNFAESLGLRGIFVWPINTDDFAGRCGEGRYPLMSLINRKISAMYVVAHRECPDKKPVTPVVACFLESWSANRPSYGQFSIEHVDATLCTHVVYCNAGLNQITKKIEILNSRITKEGIFTRLLSLKSNNPELKITVAIGGSSEQSIKYSEMAASRQTRSIFVRSVVDFLRKHELDGLDMDWRDPAAKGGRPRDKQNYVLLCQALKQEFRKYGWQLTVTLNSRLYNLDVGYDLEGLSRHVDYFYVLTYEYHGSWERMTGSSAPLYSRQGESEFFQELNVNFTVSTLLSRGVPASKLVMGIFLYGRIYRLRNRFDTSMGAPAISNANFKGKYTNELGTLGYNEVCELLHTTGVRWDISWDDEHKVPYIVRDDIWISYENEMSINLKMDFSEALTLRGAFVWAVNSDDFRGRCGAPPYPLLTLVHNRMKVAAEKRNALVNATASTVTCFLDSWSVYRPSLGQFNIEDIDVSLCTHIVYCYAGLDETNNEIVNIDPDYIRSGAYRRLLDLKKKNPLLVITVSIGGYSEGSAKYSRMAANRHRRRSFIVSVVNFLRETSFDGIDLAWDSPAHRDGRPEDKTNFVLLCKEIRNAFSRANWRFTVSLSGKKDILEKGFNLPAIVNEIDAFHLLAFNYQGPWDGVTGHPNPLSPVVWEEGKMENSVLYSVLYVSLRSVQPKKIILVVNFFGCTFKLKDASNHSIGAPSFLLGFQGPFTQNPGFIGYNEICQMNIEEGQLWTKETDPIRQLPYMYKEDKWIGYDNVTSIGLKVSEARAYNLSGVGVWSVSTDDFRGRCGMGKFPLLTEVNRALGRIVTDDLEHPKFNISDTSGTWCSVAEQANITMEVLQCGLNNGQNCIENNEVPPQTVVAADCWRTTELVMKCLPDGFWIPLKDFEDERDGMLTTNSDRMKLLCQPPLINSHICGRRPRYQRTTAVLNLASFYEPKIRWPWVVELFMNNNYKCSASIVSVDYLLTAAHCVTTSLETSTESVKPSELMVRIIGNSQVKEVKVIDIQLHPNYQSERIKLLNDIAMLKFSEPLTFNSELYPACVNFGDSMPEQIAVVFNHNPSDLGQIKYNETLKTLDKGCMMSSENCVSNLATSETQFCGLGLDGVNHLQSGSSGGPFMQDLSSLSGDEKWAVTGVVSYLSDSIECLTSYTIYTAVHSARGWIMGISQKLF